MVATSAFGMGINSNNIRVVIHVEAPMNMSMYINLFFYLLGNLIKTYFGTDYLAGVHASLNNADRLRYYVDKIQKEINPQGYGLLGVVYNYSRNIDNFCDYVKRLGN